jgi:hypothetical protein
MFIKSNAGLGAWRHNEVSSITVNQYDTYTWHVDIMLSTVAGEHLYDSYNTKKKALASRDALITQIELLETGN